MNPTTLKLVAVGQKQFRGGCCELYKLNGLWRKLHIYVESWNDGNVENGHYVLFSHLHPFIPLSYRFAQFAYFANCLLFLLCLIVGDIIYGLITVHILNPHYFHLNTARIRHSVCAFIHWIPTTCLLQEMTPIFLCFTCSLLVTNDESFRF